MLYKIYADIGHFVIRARISLKILVHEFNCTKNLKSKFSMRWSLIDIALSFSHSFTIDFF